MSTLAFRFLSWNLKDFGNYDYSGTMERIASTIINSGADIAVVLEVVANRRVKGARIADDLATGNAKTAVASLLTQLNTKNADSAWKSAISGINAGNADRDCYAFFWKTKPGGGKHNDNFLPSKITMVEGPDILRTDENDKELGFAGSRRPGACVFKLENPDAVPQAQNVLVCGFHASAEFKTNYKIQASIKHCLLAASAKSGKDKEKLPVVIGGDLNEDYTLYKSFYDSLKTDDTLGFDTALKDGKGTSLSACPNFTDSNPVIVKNAFDNFLYKRLTLSTTWQTEVIDVVQSIALDLEKKSDNNKRPFSELQKEAYLHYYTVNTGTGKTSCVSDHFPIIGAFGF